MCVGDVFQLVLRIATDYSRCHQESYHFASVIRLCIRGTVIYLDGSFYIDFEKRKRVAGALRNIRYPIGIERIGLTK